MFTYIHLFPSERIKLASSQREAWSGFGDQAQEGAGSLASADRRGEKGKQL